MKRIIWKLKQFSHLLFEKITLRSYYEDYYKKSYMEMRNEMIEVILKSNKYKVRVLKQEKINIKSNVTFKAPVIFICKYFTSRGNITTNTLSIRGS